MVSKTEAGGLVACSLFMDRLNETPGDAQELSAWITATGRRLVVIMVGQLRSARRNIAHLRCHLLDHCPHLVAVQCPAAETAIAAEVFPGAMIDGWDPGPMPVAVRYAWPVFGRSGEAARKEKSSFYYQLARQKRAGAVFQPLINSDGDVILKWRPDLRLFAPVMLRVVPDEKTLVVPSYENHGGLNDQCALGQWPVMRRYLERLKHLRAYLGQGGRLHPETYLRWVMEGTTVDRMRIACAIDRGDAMNSVKISAALGDVWDNGLSQLLHSQGVSTVRDMPEDAGIVRATDGFSSQAGRLWQSIVALTMGRGDAQ